MIQYNRGGIHILWNFIQKDGSVFPISFLIAFPCGIVAAGLKFLIDSDLLSVWSVPEGILKESTAWGSVQFLVGFLIVFRTSQAYARFQDGCAYMHQMRAHWYAGCAAAVSFSKGSESELEKQVTFQHILIRLVSMLHAVALAEVEDCSSKNDPTTVAAFRYPLLDASALDMETLENIRDCDSRVELAYQWIQNLLGENQTRGVLREVPAPLLAVSLRSFLDGMVAFNEAIKVSTIPFPFPYAQTCDWILVLHWVLTPIIVAAWVGNMVWAFIFAFLQVFILWSLNAIAIEIENPFGLDANDIDAEQMQDQLNHNLCLLIHPSAMRTPALHHSWSIMEASSAMGFTPSGASKGKNETDNMWRTTTNNMRRRQSLQDVWEDVSAAQRTVLHPGHSGHSSHTGHSSPTRLVPLSALAEKHGRSSSSSSQGTGSAKSAVAWHPVQLEQQETLESGVSGVSGLLFQLESASSRVGADSPTKGGQLYASEGDNIPRVLNDANAVSLPVKRYTSRDKKRAKAAKRWRGEDDGSKSRDGGGQQRRKASVRETLRSAVSSGMGLVPSAKWSSKRSSNSSVDGDYASHEASAAQSPVRAESTPSVGTLANLAAGFKSGDTMKITISDKDKDKDEGRRSSKNEGGGESSAASAPRRVGHEDGGRSGSQGVQIENSSSPDSLSGAEVPRALSSAPMPHLMADSATPPACTTPPSSPGDIESSRIKPDASNRGGRGRPHAPLRRLAI